ncbi:hypothetical protein BMW22_26505 (plasmid) [Rhizobium leguminosarum]|uniref:Uncharacterized protein n=1 Tax=Rhizobium leguminosarum TaxID=384 RepID=A0A1L3ZHM1_RHILE|nr:hypothetical protein BMW22_26505 [Rhizobium leguminosarum]
MSEVARDPLYRRHRFPAEIIAQRAMSRCLIKVGTGRLSETSGGCAGHGFPLRHCADPMDVDGEG